MKHKVVVKMESDLSEEEFEEWLKNALEQISATSEKTVEVTYISTGSQLDFLT